MLGVALDFGYTITATVLSSLIAAVWFSPVMFGTSDVALDAGLRPVSTPVFIRGAILLGCLFSMAVALSLVEGFLSLVVMVAVITVIVGLGLFRYQSLRDIVVRAGYFSVAGGLMIVLNQIY